MKAKVYCDGRGNAGIGQGACAFQMFVEDGRVIEEGKSLDGDPTNNEAEYKAIIFALETAVELEISYLQLFSDSKVIVNQITEKFDCRKPELKIQRDNVLELGRLFNSVSIEWVSRNKMKVPDKLCRKIAKANC